MLARILPLAVFLFIASTSHAAQLHIGTATASITPDEPVAVSGQFHLRIAKTVESPVTANVVALESRDGDRSLDAAVVVSCDLVSIPPDLLAMVRQAVKSQVPDLDPQKIFLNATHTHTGPVVRLGKYDLPAEGVIQVAEYREFFTTQVATAITEAWNARKPGSVGWGLGHAVVAYNRRRSYADGRAQMYGATTGANFRSLEGYEDHDIGVLFFYDDAGKPIAMAVNVACPSQEVESRSAVNADFWHPVREQLRERYGSELCVLGWTGASGDQSPHLMYRKAADERMRSLRGLNRLEEIARRIVRAVDDVYEVVQNERSNDAPLAHTVKTLELPRRLVTVAEHAEAQAAVAAAEAKIAANPTTSRGEFRRQQWYQATVDRFENQKTEPNPTYSMELHVVRIGDVAICTNSFELYTDFGIRIKARSKAVQTFPIQLVGLGTYIPTAKAVRGGHYSAIVHSSHVGPEGGQVLVDQTVETINQMFSGK